MQYSLLILATLTLVCLTKGQYIPTTPCGQQAQICFNQNKDNVRKKLVEFNFRGACKEAKALFSCLSQVPVADSCNELQTFRDLASNLTNGICQPEGEGTTICVDRLGPCLQYAYIIKNDFANNNATRACPALNELNSCAEDIMKQNVCSSNVIAQLNQARTALSEDVMLDGCDGTCAKAIANCSLKLAAVVSNQPLVQTNWTDFCIKANSTYRCVDNLSYSTVCMGSSDFILVQKMMSSYIAYLKNYCIFNAAPTMCMVGLEGCKFGLSTLNAQSTVSEECHVAAKFLECTTQLSCETQLKAVVESVRLSLENEETTNHCPMVGTCADRLKGCKSIEDKLKLINNVTQTTEFCGLVESAINCFDFVRRDPICSKEQPDVTDFKANLKEELIHNCGGGGIVSEEVTMGSCSEILVACQGNGTSLESIKKFTGEKKFCKIVAISIECYDFVRNNPICSTKKNLIVNEFETTMVLTAAPECGDTIGNCTERLKICAESERILAVVDNTTQKDLFCNRTRRGVACFDTVRRNPNCTVDKVEVSHWESKLKHFVAPYCGGASIVHIPLLVIVACVLVSVNHVFLPLWERK